MIYEEKALIKRKLSNLIEKYNVTLRGKSHKDVSEETIRTWINEFLLIFGWAPMYISYLIPRKKTVLIPPDK